MKQFKYTAVTTTNQRFEGIVEANDKQQAVEILREKKLLVISLKDLQANFLYKLNLQFAKVKHNDVIMFTRQFATMTNAGLPIISALQLVARSSKPAFQKVLEQIILAVEGGETLHSAMSVHKDAFSGTYLALVKAGEVGGILGTVMESLADNMEKQKEFNAKVKAAMLYPTVVMAAMIVVMLIMMFVVIPKMADIYSDFEADLPFSTEFLISLSEWLKSFWYLAVLITFGAVYGITTWLHTPNGKHTFDAQVLRIPYIGELAHKVISTNIARTLGILIKSGVSILDGLNIVADVSGNTVYQEGIKKAAASVEKGVPLATSFATAGFFPEQVIRMISIGEETGKIDEMLEKIATQYQKESEIALKALTSAIEPAMIIILGVGVGGMVISIIVPIYNLTSSF